MAKVQAQKSSPWLKPYPTKHLGYRHCALTSAKKKDIDISFSRQIWERPRTTGWEIWFQWAKEWSSVIKQKKKKNDFFWRYHLGRNMSVVETHIESIHDIMGGFPFLFLIQRFIGHPIRETVADPCLCNGQYWNDKGNRHWDDTHLINELVPLRVKKTENKSGPVLIYEHARRKICILHSYGRMTLFEPI